MDKKIKILVVEDERIVGEDIRQSLKSLGYTVSAITSSGREALKKTEEKQPDLILMDIVIHGEISGIETAEHIRSVFDIPVVYLTAYADEKTLERAKVTEPYGYILKPFDDRELHSTIEMALYKHRMERTLRNREAWFSTTLRSIGDAVIATDKKGRITFMNTVAETLTGWKQDESIGEPLKQVFNIFSEETEKPIRSPVNQILREEKVVGLSKHTILIAKNGNRIPIDDSVAPIKDDRGKIVGVVLVFKDITERKRAEEELRKAENEKEVILSSVSELVTYQDRQLRIVWANRAAGESVGLPAEDLVGRMCYAIWQQRSDPCDGCPVVKAIETGKPQELEVTTPDGRIWFVRGYPVRDENGGVKGAVEVTLEITERKRAEEALRVSEERYRGLFETMDQGVLYYNSHKEVIDGNPAAETILGMPLSEMIGQTPLDPRLNTVKEDGLALPMEDHPVINSFQTGESTSNVVLGIQTLEGSRKWLLVSATPVYTEGETKPAQVFATFTDITRRREIEFALKKRNIQLNSLNVIARVVSETLDIKVILKKALTEVIRLAEFSGGALFLFDEDKSSPELEIHQGVSLRVVNRLGQLHAEKSSLFRRSLMRGQTKFFSVDELLDGSLAEHHIDDNGESAIQCIVVPIKARHRVVGSLNLFGPKKYMPAEMDFEFFSSIGRHVGLAVTNARLYEETNQTLEKLRITQDKLVQSEKLAGLGAMASNVVHEIGNPLAAITNSVQVLQSRVQFEGQMKELMDIIGWEADRLNRCVDQLREFSRPRHLKIVKSDLREVVKKAIIVLSQDFELMWGRKIVTRFPKELPSVLVDPDAMEQVAINLIKNGLQAAKEDSMVEVRLHCRGKGSKKRIQLGVKDNGPGISEENMKMIFEPYFSTKARGMGLGMHIVHQIVESHGGRIRVKSEEGQGTTIIVEIPLEREDNGKHSGS